MSLLRNSLLARFTIPASELGIAEDERAEFAVLFGDVEVFLDLVERLGSLDVRLRTDRPARDLADELLYVGNVAVLSMPARHFREIATRLGRCLEVQKAEWLQPGWDAR